MFHIFKEVDHSYRFVVSTILEIACLNKFKKIHSSVGSGFEKFYPDPFKKGSYLQQLPLTRRVWSCVRLDKDVGFQLSEMSLTVWDKARRPGGRMTTHLNPRGVGQVDLGPQFITGKVRQEKTFIK